MVGQKEGQIANLMERLEDQSVEVSALNETIVYLRMEL